MAIFNGTIFSKELWMETELIAILPTIKADGGVTKSKNVLYLLHGISENHTKWLRMSDIEEYANNYGVAVIMPNGLRSFYCDMEYGLKYFTYISKELPKICEDIFNIPNKRENKFIAGLSMGGYGAFKCAFTYPEDYAGCGSFSGAVDTDFVKKYIFNSPQYSKEAFAILGDDIKPDNDLFYLSSLANNSKYDLKVYQSCGKQDFLYTSNIKFKNHLEKLNFNYKFMEWDGEHNWSFWRKSIEYLFDYFFNNLNESK